MTLYCSKKTINIVKRNNIKDNGDFYFRIVFIRLEQRRNLNHMKKYEEIKISVLL